MQKNKKDKSVQITPPYLSIIKLERTLDLVSRRSKLPDDASIFFEQQDDFTRISSLLAVNALKFLGILDENGKPTELMAKLRLTGPARTKVFEDIVKNSYRKLFESVDEPQNLPSDELMNEFHIQYDLSPRIVSTAVPVFLRLCELGGLKEEGTVLSRKPNKKKSKKNKVEKSKENQKGNADNPQEEGFETIPIADNLIVIKIPTEIKNKLFNDEKMYEKWSKVRKEIEEFAFSFTDKNPTKESSKAVNIEPEDN